MASRQQLQEIRDMGEALTRARELCAQAQFDKGLPLYQDTMQTLRQFIRRMHKMSERQPWLQVRSSVVLASPGCHHTHTSSHELDSTTGRINVFRCKSSSRTSSV